MSKVIVMLAAGERGPEPRYLVETLRRRYGKPNTQEWGFAMETDNFSKAVKEAKSYSESWLEDVRIIDRYEEDEDGNTAA